VLLKLLAEFNATVAAAGIPVVNLARLAEESPAGQRRDLKSDLNVGFPYSLAHADAVALALSRLLCPPVPKKGLITDLDDTLWSGIVGEVGPQGVHWDLDRHSHIHALYQSLLTSLSDSGVLLAVASKNDPDIVHKAFEREDLLLERERIFPMEVHWNAKSTSVSRILIVRWNWLKWRQPIRVLNAFNSRQRTIAQLVPAFAASVTCLESLHLLTKIRSD
jgi:HAD superfamily phosphatase (TIGR01681 family)